MSRSGRFLLWLAIVAVFAPAPGRSLTATGDGIIVISWEADPLDRDVAGYRVYVSTDRRVFRLEPSKAQRKLRTLTVGADARVAVVEALAADVVHHIAVTSYDSEGNESEFSDVVSGLPCPIDSSGTIEVSWDSPGSAGIAGHRVFLATDPAVFDQGPGEARWGATTRFVPAGTDRAGFAGLDPSTTYHVAVTSLTDDDRESPLSRVISAVPQPAPTVCAVSPREITQGTSERILTLYGAGFDSGTDVDLGPGIVVEMVDSTGAPTTLQVVVRADSSAPLDPRDIAVIDRDGRRAVKIDGFEVLLDSHRADVDGSGRIDDADVAILAKSFTARPGDPRYSQRLDLNSDGTIDGLDLSLLVSLLAPGRSGESSPR